MAKFSNLLVMLELLNTGRKYSVKELSSALEVSERVIREHKLFLEEAGIYVDTIRGPYGGYILRKNITIPPLLIDNNDIDIIKQVIKNTTNNKLKSSLKNIENKITKNLLELENNNTSFINTEEELKVYNALNKAIKYNYKVKIKYTNLQHGESVRTIYPLGMYLFQNEWWCSSYWEEKDDMRQFHIKRILECKILDSTFNPKKINIKF